MSDVRRERRAMSATVNPASIAIRAVVVALSGVAVGLIPPESFAVYGFALIGTVLAVVAPNRAGALFLITSDIIGWTSSYGAHAEVPAARTIAFAVALYLLHASVALAASVPATASVHPAVVRQWALNCVPAVIIAVPMGLAVTAIGRPAGSLSLDVAGFAAALAVIAALIVLSRSRR